MTIYLDYAATAPMRQEALEAYVESATTTIGNPSSIHAYGRAARQQLDRARRLLSTTIHAKPNEIVLTSGGTEADNLAIFGVAHANEKKGNHFITTAIEHPAVLKAFELLERQGYEVTYLQPDTEGRITTEQVERALRPTTVLVSIMYGNNEVGTLQPIEEIGTLLAPTDIYFHTDAVQAYGVVPIDVEKCQIDLLSTSAHKIGGPRGVGFLYVRQGVLLSPFQVGGDQERKRRGGTENVPSVVAFARAAELAVEEMDEMTSRYESFTKQMIQRLEEASIDYAINASKANRLPHICNIAFAHIDVESFLVRLDLKGVAASSGSACTAGALEPSHVLVAMYGKEDLRMRQSIRFSYGPQLTEQQIQAFGDILVELLQF